MEISKLTPLTYSMLLNNIDIAKSKHIKSTWNIINLEKLVKSFKLDSSFISKSYYQSNPEFVYNEPPKGPIPAHFECLYCNQEAPDFHLINCTRPFEQLLVLSKDHLGHPAGTPYDLVIKKRGQQKVISESIKTERFTDNVEIIYKNITNCVIRIAKNGSINIISLNFKDTVLPKKIVKKINESGALIESGVFSIDPNYSYTYIILAQFNLYPKDLQDLYYIDLNLLNTILWETPEYHRNFESKDAFMTNTEIYFVKDYRFNSGELRSRNNKITNPYIIFNLIPRTTSNIKVGVMIYKRGAVQLRLTFIDSKNISEVLEYQILVDAHRFLKDLLYFPEILTSEQEIHKKGIPNMTDSKQPQKCQNRPGNIIRPEPYSFYGKCPTEGYYVRPEGMKRSDSKFEPCCYRMKEKGKDSKEYYNNVLKNGYSVPEPDTNSAVFIPGTKIIESRGFKGLNSIPKKELIDCIKSAGHITDDIYFSFQESVLKEYSSVTKTKNLVIQGASALINPELIKTNYMVTPVMDSTLNVLLFFNNLGESYFINLNKDISKSELPAIGLLANTIIEGYLYPFKTDFTFYPVDIIYFKGDDVTQNIYYGPGNSRFVNLMFSVNLIKGYSLEVITNFDLNVTEGSKYYSKFDISGLLFIPFDEIYTPGKVNKRLFLWTNLKKQSNKTVVLQAFKNNDGYTLKVNGKTVVQNIKLNDEINDGDLIEFKVNGMIPVKKVDYLTNDYSDVISLLESVKNPLAVTAIFQN